MRPIESVIPHRPPFLFIDSIESIDENGLVAKRKIREEEPHFAGHYPGNPIMPGVLLCEATFQAAAYYLVETKFGGDFGAGELTPILARIIDARFKQMVVPGDEVTIEVTYKEARSHFHFLKGKVVKNGKVALAVEFALALVDKKPEQTQA